MTTKESVKYLIQVALPFILLGSLKNSIFFLPAVLILFALPFDSSRNNLIKYWKKLGELLSKIVSPVVLSLIYYIGLTPLALIKRLTSNDTLSLKRPKKSNFKEVSFTLKRDDFENLW